MTTTQNLPATRIPAHVAARRPATVVEYVEQPARLPAVVGGPSLSTVVTWFGALSAIAGSLGVAARYLIPHLL